MLKPLKIRSPVRLRTSSKEFCPQRRQRKLISRKPSTLLLTSLKLLRQSDSRRLEKRKRNAKRKRRKVVRPL